MKTEFMPLPDNDAKTINMAVDNIYRTLKDIEGKTGFKGADETWQNQYVSAPTDVDRINVIARFLGITTLEV